MIGHVDGQVEEGRDGEDHGDDKWQGPVAQAGRNTPTNQREEHDGR